MTRILFVDDEPMLLAGLRRMLHRYHDVWEMEFAEGATQALEMLERAPFDVVVSDMRMPGIDGGELLSEVQRLYPHVVRIVLSGQSDKERTMQAVGLAHQYLAKPCDPQQLLDTINSTCNLRKQFDNPLVRQLAGQTDSLPTLPDVYRELVHELDSPSSSLARVGEIISSDIAISAKILQLVNSSFFGLPVHVSDLPHAVTLLGLGVVKPLVLSSGLFQQFSPDRLGRFSLAGLVDHSVEVAMSARCLAQMEGIPAPACDDAFMAGMMHDLGQLVLAQAYPAQYDHILQTASDQELPLVEVERAEFGATHAEVGAYLLGLWGLPSEVIEAVAWHHQPEISTHTSFTPLAAVHVSESFLVPDLTADYEQARLSRDFIQRLGLSHRVKEWSTALGVEETASPGAPPSDDTATDPAFR